MKQKMSNRLTSNNFVTTSISNNFKGCHSQLRQQLSPLHHHTHYSSLKFVIITTIIIFLLLCQVTCINGDTNRFYHVSKLCVRDRNFPLYKKIDGAVIESESESDIDCVLTFQTDSILQRFMLRFDTLALDCNDHLYVYDGAHAFGNYKADLSCRSTRGEIGTIFTQSNFLTLKYVTDRYSKPGDGFKLIITAFKDTPSMGCNQLKCQNTFCISKDLACDTVNHCGDESDESSHAFCYTAKSPLDPMSKIMGIDFNLFMGAILCVFVICLICVVHLAVCLCRNGSNGGANGVMMMNNGLSQQHRIALHGQSTAQLAGHPSIYAATLGTPLTQPGTTRYATLPLDKRENKIPPPYPGNGIYGQLNGGLNQQQQQQQYVTTSMSNNQVGHVMVTDGVGMNLGSNGMMVSQQQQGHLAQLNGPGLNGHHLNQQQQHQQHMNGGNNLNGMIPLQQVVYYTTK